MVKCKYHNTEGIISNVKIPLYIEARFRDVANQWREVPGHGRKFHQASMELGPSGYPFEKYIAELLKHNGVEVKVGIVVKGHYFHLPDCPHCTLAFSRILFDQELVVVYNSSSSDAKEEYILVDYNLNKDKKYMNCIYGHSGSIEILKHDDQSIRFIKIYLQLVQFVIVKNK